MANKSGYLAALVSRPYIIKVGTPELQKGSLKYAGAVKSSGNITTLQNSRPRLICNTADFVVDGIDVGDVVVSDPVGKPQGYVKVLEIEDGQNLLLSSLPFFENGEGFEVYSPEMELNSYIVEVMERLGTEKGIIIRHKFSVYKENDPAETAFGEYDIFYKENNPVYQNIVDYIVGNITNGKAHWIKELDYNRNTSKVKCFVDTGTSIEEKWYLIWDDTGLTHKEITVTL